MFTILQKIEPLTSESTGSTVKIMSIHDTYASALQHQKMGQTIQGPITYIPSNPFMCAPRYPPVKRFSPPILSQMPPSFPSATHAAPPFYWPPRV
jgi:hypothetical protein